MPSAPGHTVGIINMWALVTALHPCWATYLGMYWFRANVPVLCCCRNVIVGALAQFCRTTASRLLRRSNGLFMHLLVA